MSISPRAISQQLTRLWHRCSSALRGRLATGLDNQVLPQRTVDELACWQPASDDVEPRTVTLPRGAPRQEATAPAPRPLPLKHAGR